MKAKANAQVNKNNTKENVVMSNKVVINGKEYEAKSRVGNIPYTDIPDGLMEFHVQTLRYNGSAILLQGVIWPYRMPEKMARFVYTAAGKTAQYALSNIMPKYDEAYAAEKEYWFIMRRFEVERECPTYTKLIPELEVNDTFIVDAKHYNKFLQLDFATYRFQAKIDAANKIPRDFNVENPKCPETTQTNASANTYYIQVNDTANKTIESVTSKKYYKQIHNNLLKKYAANVGYTIFVSDVNKGKVILTTPITRV